MSASDPRYLELNRREFCRLAAVGLAALAAGPALGATLPPRVVRALRQRNFPGRLVPLTDAAIRHPALWAG